MDVPQHVRIHEIQGRAHVSPWNGREVVGVAGVVTAVDKNGFFIQDDEPDDEVDTSNALFVFTAVTPQVAVGHRVRVSGRVGEFYPGRDEARNLPITQIQRPRVELVEIAQTLPKPVQLGAGGREIPAGVVEDDADGFVDLPGVAFDPETDALDFFESLEGMRVRVDDCVVVGPLNRFGEIVVLADQGAAAEPRTERGGLTRVAGDVNPERVMVDNRILPQAPPANVGDEIGTIVGVLDYRHGHFKILNTEPLTLRPGGLRPQTASIAGGEDGLTVASYNVLNLNRDDPERLDALARQIVERLLSPDIIALQEVQDDSGRRDDRVTSGSETFRRLTRAVHTHGGPRYDFRQIDPRNGEDGGEPGGNIRCGYLFDPERVRFRARFTAPCFARLPHLKNRPFTSAGRLFADSDVFFRCRKPLLAEFEFRGVPHIFFNVHLSSKRGSAPLFGRAQPPADHTEEVRQAQTRALRAVVVKMLRADSAARIFVLGDFNDLNFASPLRELTAGRLEGRLVNLCEKLSPAERYTYIHNGNGQALDHMIVSSPLVGAEFEVIHCNTEFAQAVSDHDPILARFPAP